MRALLALGDGCGFKSGASHDLWPLRRGSKGVRREIVTVAQASRLLFPASRRKPSGGEIATTLSDAPPPVSFPARATSDLAAVDPARRTQRCLDGGFQRFLSHRRRHPLRSAHRPRSLQSLSPGGTHSAAPAPGRSATGVYRPVPPLRFAQGDPHGQRLAFRQHGRLGSFGPECVVVDFGHPRRVYPTRPSRGEWRA